MLRFSAGTMQLNDGRTRMETTGKRLGMRWLDTAIVAAA
jgi:hypothetical protein